MNILLSGALFQRLILNSFSGSCIQFSVNMFSKLIKSDQNHGFDQICLDLVSFDNMIFFVLRTILAPKKTALVNNFGNHGTQDVYEQENGFGQVQERW